MPREYKRRSPKERLLAKCIIPEDPDMCWGWKASCQGPHYKNGRGYGQHDTGGYRAKKMAAHKASYLLHNGEIPKGMVVRHTCDVTTCCNPRHLVLGTQYDNLQDCKERGRTSKGERQFNAKLSDDAVRDIRRSLQKGTSRKALAHKYDVSVSLIGLVATNKIWTHVI